MPMEIAENSLVLIMSSQDKVSFDFVGRYVWHDEHYFYLRKVLAISYGDRFTPTGLQPAHLPYGFVDIVDQDNVTLYPHDAVGYMTILPPEGKDWIHLEYESFFNKTPATE